MPKIVDLDKQEVAPVARELKLSYANTEIARPTALLALANSLSDFNPKLHRFAAAKAEEQKNKDISKGVTLFDLNENKQAWVDFVKTNPQYAKANPWIKEGYKKANAMNDANTYSTFIYSKSLSEEAVIMGADGSSKPLVEGTPAEQTQWVRSMRKQFMENYLPKDFDTVYYHDVFSPLATRTEHAWLGDMTNQTQDHMLNKATAAYSGNIQIALRNYFQSGQFDGVDAADRLQDIGAEMTDFAREMATTGIRMTAVNSTMLQAIYTIAQELDDEDLEDLFTIPMYIETAKGSYLGSIPAVQKQLADAHQNVLSNNYSKRMQKEALEKIDKEKEADAMMATIAMKYFENPDAITNEERKEFMALFGLPSLNALDAKLAALQSANNDLAGGAAKYWYAFATGGRVNPNAVWNDPNLSTSDKKSLFSAIAEKREREAQRAEARADRAELKLATKVEKTLQSVRPGLDAILLDVVAGVTSSKDKDLVTDEQYVVIHTVGMMVATQIEGELKQDPSLMDASSYHKLQHKLRVLVKENYTTYNETYGKPQPTPKPANPPAKPPVTPPKQAKPKVDLLSGMTQEHKTATVGLATEYLDAVARGLPTDGLGFTKYYRLVSPKLPKGVDVRSAAEMIVGG